MQEITFSQLAKFHLKQLEAYHMLFDNRCKYLLYGGAAHGGKSYFLRWAAIGLGIYYSAKYNVTDVPIGLFSEDYPTLKDRQIIKFKHEVPEWLGELKETRDEGFAFIARPQYGSFVILFRNLDDPSKYLSAEFAGIFVDELTRNPIETFEDLRFRLRYKDVGEEVKFVAATNPGGIGHAWVKKLWIEQDLRNPDREQDRFFFIRSLPSDNPYTYESYLEQLRSMPEQKRKAWLEGSWEIAEGQVFTEFSRETHVIKPFAIPKDWNIYGAIDLGWNKPMAVGWYAVDTEGRTYLFKELYGNAEWFEIKFGNKMTAKRIAVILNAISDKMNKEQGIKLPDYWVGDPAMWNKILREGEIKPGLDVEGESYAEIMINAGLKLIAGDNNRENGMARYREALSIAPDGKPWYQIFETCFDTARTIPSLIYDEHKHEDVDTDGEDHCYDRDRYFFMSRPGLPTIKEKPKSLIRRVYLKKIKESFEEEGGELDYAETDFEETI